MHAVTNYPYCTTDASLACIGRGVTCYRPADDRRVVIGQGRVLCLRCWAERESERKYREYVAEQQAAFDKLSPFEQALSTSPMAGARSPSCGSSVWSL